MQQGEANAVASGGGTAAEQSGQSAQPTQSGKAGPSGAAAASPSAASEESPPSALPALKPGSKPAASTPDKAAAQPGTGSRSAKPGSGGASTAKPDKDEGKYQYLTDPVPEGKPKPVEPQDTKINHKKALTATLSVSAATILNHMDQLNKDKLEVLPKDGVIYKAQKVTFYEGESVFDVLLREMKNNKIHMEFEMTPIYNSNYVEGINNIYEFDCGELSGWMYKVNGWFPNYGSSRYKLKDGDVVEWVYTCDLGRDVGDNSMAGGQQ
ncbi:DUF4430 domain-containing protein [Paenibacillus protaetiae]|uniref:DUF4430 domain-containing protein n=1 Tax=Paenibacillus protaetiae TaxID=2509456 RepID=UPI001FC9521B|nr:DUF4430 domain-containing protein [Paenibacillus protaetiae]